MAVGEWDQRQLCPDGACVGVIGPDGTCKVCGRAAPNWGDERTRGLLDPPDDESDDDDEDDDGDGLAADHGDADDDDDEDDGDDDDDEDGDDAGDPADAADAVKGDGDTERPPLASGSTGWSSRQLCSDGACIGLIGPDGRCKVCGRTATSSAREQAGDAAVAESANSDAKARVSCSDAACPGAIGADGHCDVCGRVAA